MSIPNAGYRTTRPGRYGRVRAGMDPATRRLVVFAAGLAVLLACLIGLSTLLGHRGASVPVVTADARPIRVKPENPGGMQIDGAENDVFSGGVDNSHSKLSAASEAPNPNGMHGAAVAPPPHAPVMAEAHPGDPPAAQPAASPAAATQPSPVRPAATAPVPHRSVNGVANQAPAVAVAPGSPASAIVAPVSPPVTAGALANAAPAAERPAMVQFAALTSEQAAHDEWQQLGRRMPDLLNGRQPSFSRIDRDGHTYWRVRTAGFADSAQAKAFCERVRAKGGGCSVADF